MKAVSGLIIFLFLHKNICCGYSLEVPLRGTSNEYPQQMFLWRNKKNKGSDQPAWAALPANCIIAFYVHCSSFGFSIS